MTKKNRRRWLMAGTGVTLLTVALLMQSQRTPLVKVGQLAPDFSLPDQEGTATRLFDARGKWVILAFYPMDGTPG